MEHDPQNFDPRKLDVLLALAEQGELTHEQGIELNHILRENKDAIEQASEYFVMEALLRSELMSNATGNLLDSEEPMLPTYLEDNIQPLSSKKIEIFLAAAAVAIVLGVLGILLQSKNSDTRHAEKPNASDAPVAKLVKELDIRFAPQSSPLAGNFKSGDYILEKGIAELEFRTGAKFVIEGPAQFSIKNDMHVFLKEGNIRARIPEKATGFRIDAPEVDVVDLGTEFGIAVKPDKKTEVHVFSGEVELHEASFPKPRLVREGFAADWRKGTPAVILNTPNEEKFRTPQDIHRSLGEQLYDRLIVDEALVALYDFQPHQSSQGKLVNLASPGLLDGQVHGATWVQGRQQGSGALLFENSGDRVAINFPGEFPEFTLSTWLKADRFDSYIITILNSNSYEYQEHHWQIMNNGSIRAAQLGKETQHNHEVYRIDSEENVVSLGKWTHLAATFSLKSGDACYYANGKLIASTPIDSSLPARFGNSHIGYWGFPAHKSWPKKRDFRGRIGELLFLKRAMSHTEILELYELGKPANW